MSWLARLVETYDACAGREQFTNEPLPPLSAVPQTTQLLIRLWEDGSFLSAEWNELDNTPLFVTENSASRSGRDPAPNPLTEQLEYCASGMADYGGDPTKHERYCKLLKQWSDSGDADKKVAAVLAYVEAGTLLEDLQREKLLMRDNAIFAKVKVGRGGGKDPAKQWVRWSVANCGLHADTWSDTSLAEKWARFEASLVERRSLCMLSGTVLRTTQKHPKRIRDSGDNAKLVSSNDTDGFTFRGRFDTSDQALAIGHEATQKAHNALRWLIKRQGARQGEQVIVCWAVQGGSVPPLLVDSAQLFLDEPDTRQAEGYEGDAGQAFGLRLCKAVQGYRVGLGDTANIVVMALDSATKGRMAILYYRELKGSEFLDRVERWHERLAWPQNFGKDNRFTGAPAPRDIAEAAYGRRVDEKLRKATVERLLPCIVDGSPVPRDLEKAAVARATNRVGLEPWEFERVLGIACSLVRGANPRKAYKMNLEENRASRDYLYGRLLAVADSIEELALKVGGEGRETNAARLMQRFADHPFTTWRTIALQLRPYIARLRNSRYAGALTIRQRLLDRLTSSFVPSEFTDNHRLSGEFLLGYHCQREALRAGKNGPEVQKESEGEQE